MEATSKVHQWHTHNFCIRLANSLYEPYQSLSSAPWAIGPLTLLESITKVPDQHVVKTGKLSFDFFLSVCVSQASMIQMRKTQHKSLGIALTTCMILKKLELVCDSQVTPGVWKTWINGSADHGLQCKSGLESPPLQTVFNCNLTHPFVAWRTKTGALTARRIVCP